MAREFSVRTGVIPEEFHEEWYELPSDKLMEFARLGELDFTQLKRGDGVRFGDIDGERNDGLMLWDGEKLIQLDFEVDEYGSVPNSLPINNFPTVLYFANLIEHNSLVYFDQMGFNLKQGIMRRVTGQVVRVKVQQGEKMYHIYTPFVSELLERWATQTPILLASSESTGGWENPDSTDANYALYDEVGFQKVDAEGWDLNLPPVDPEQERLGKQIVDLVRQKIMPLNASHPESDPWDEGEGGVAWLDNEVYMATELFKKLYPGQKYPSGDRYRSVPAFQAALANLGLDELSIIRTVLELGGSDNNELFELRTCSPKQIREYLASH